MFLKERAVTNITCLKKGGAYSEEGVPVVALLFLTERKRDLAHWFKSVQTYPRLKQFVRLETVRRSQFHGNPVIVAGWENMLIERSYHLNLLRGPLLWFLRSFDLAVFQPTIYQTMPARAHGVPTVSVSKNDSPTVCFKYLPFVCFTMPAFSFGHHGVYGHI